jgi:hypothetical protein
MATTYANISSATTTTLITKGGGVNGSISKITIANHDDSDSNTVQLHLYDGSSVTYVIVETIIPARATLVLEDNVSFNSGLYNLRLVTSSTADTTVIIK